VDTGRPPSTRTAPVRPPILAPALAALSGANMGVSPAMTGSAFSPFETLVSSVRAAAPPAPATPTPAPAAKPAAAPAPAPAPAPAAPERKWLLSSTGNTGDLVAIWGNGDSLYILGREGSLLRSS